MKASIALNEQHTLKFKLVEAVKYSKRASFLQPTVGFCTLQNEPFRKWFISVFQCYSCNFAFAEKHQSAIIQGFQMHAGTLNTTTLPSGSLPVLRQHMDFWSWLWGPCILQWYGGKQYKLQIKKISLKFNVTCIHTYLEKTLTAPIKLKTTIFIIISDKTEVTSVKHTELFHGVCYKYNNFRHWSVHCTAASTTDPVTWVK